MTAPVCQLLKQDRSKLFALYDAAQDENTLLWLESKGLRLQCLYAGTKATTLRQVAPYVIAPLPFALSGEDFVSNAWGRGVSMFVESEAPLEVVARQLKKSAFVRRSDGATCYFRYYDARVFSRFVRLAEVQQMAQLVGDCIDAVHWLEATSASIRSLVAVRRKGIRKVQAGDLPEFTLRELVVPGARKGL